jgi:signal transduction histidine kinase
MPVEQKHTVLIIDDYLPARDAVRLALKGDFKCLCADSARQGLEILRTNPVDVVVLDIRMPEMDGIEALRRIKEMKANAQVILLTGYASLETAQKAVRYGAFDYLIKPFNVENLRSIVAEAAQKKSLLEEQGRDTDFKKLTDLLATRLAEASRASRAGELSSEALREMKNPLTAILGYTQMLLQNLRDRRIKLFSTKSMRYLSIIEEEANRCVEIAARLASLPPESLSRNGVMVNEALLNVAALLRPQCSIKGVELAVSMPTEKVVVDVPSDQLHGVLVSLLVNSLEAIDGPGEIGLKGYTFNRVSPLVEFLTDFERDFLRGVLQGNIVAMEVSDSGCGIAPEHLQKIFDPSFTTKAERSSTGFSLSVCKEKVESSGGHLGVVSSRLGETVMRILLPVSSRV